MSSIITNNSAMNALSTLRNINKNLSNTQDRISTGLKVGSAKDNAAYFSISETMSSESGMNKSISEGLTLAKNSVSTARLGAETVKDLAKQFVERVAFAQENNVSKADVGKELTSLADQMARAISQSGFNGENLLDNAAGKTIVTGASGAGGETSVTTLTVGSTDLSAWVADFATLATSVTNYDPNAATDAAYITTNDLSGAGQVAADADTMAEILDAASKRLGAITTSATELGIAEKAIETQQSFLTALTDRLDSGVGSMIDADMEEEAARLQSLQVQQQLATQSLSIANQAPQNILSLFR